MNQDNVITFPVKEKNFSEKIDDLIQETEQMQVSPNGELAKNLLLAIMEDDQAKADEIQALIERQQKAGLTILN